MMIASSLVVGISAARVAEADYVTTPAVTSKVLDCTVGDGCYIYCSDLNVSGQTVQFDLWLGENGGTYSDGWGLSWLNIHSDKIGVGGTTIATSIATNAWHAMEFVVGSGETTISVDGVEVGTVAAQLDKFACGIEDVKFDNIVVGDKSQDFEGYEVGYDAVGAGRWYFSSDGAGGSSIQVAEITPASTDLVVTKNVDRYYGANKFLDTTIGDGCYIYCSDLNVSGQAVEFDLWLGEGGGTYSDVWGLQWLNLHTDKIGVGSTTINTTALTPDTWHHVVFDVGSGETEIAVDGTTIGTVAAQLDKFACGIENAKFDNIVVGDKSQDFEGYEVGYDAVGAGRWYFSSDGAGGSQISQEQVAKDYDLGSYYWLWDSENQYAYVNGLNSNFAKWEFDAQVLPAGTDARSYFGNDPILTANTQQVTKFAKCDANGHFADESPVNGVTDNFTMRIVLKSSTDTFENADLGEMVGWLDGSPLINMKAGTISFVGAPSTLNYTFADETLYTIDFVVDGDTTVFVNGEEVGTIAKNMRAIVYGVFYRYLVNEISFIQNGSVFGGVDVDDLDGVCGYLADAEIVSETAVVPGTIGVGGTTLPYSWDGDWHHIVMDGEDGDGTDIWVDGVFLGTVATAIKAAWCGKPGDDLGIDNLKITGNGNDYFEDFEDQSFAAYDGNGAATLYDFDLTPPEPEKTILDYIETEEPGGSAYLVSGGYNYELGQDPDDVGEYFDFTGVNPGTHEYVINLDLALIDETDTSGDTYFEIWTNTASRRWVVGEVTGRSDNGAKDFTPYDWGEFTPDNFHNVTYEFRKTMGRIYVDGVLVYENKAGTTWDNLMIGYVWNGTAIIDNVKLYTFTDTNATQPNELEEKAISFSGESDVRTIDLDAADFCAANGHIQHHTNVVTTPYCTTTGVNTTYCAICGAAVKDTTVPALGHNWPNYYNGVQKGDGVWTWACKRCGQEVSTTVPEVTSGTLAAFLDFADATVVQEVANKFNADGQVVAGGVGTFEVGCGQNYNQYDIPSQYKSDYTIAFDLNVKELFNDNDTAGYGHKIYFWFGGVSGMANQAGYDFDNGCFFIKAENGSPYDAVTVPYELSFDRWYQIMFKVHATDNTDDPDNSVSFYVDGELVATLDDPWDVAENIYSTVDFSIIRDFGVSAEIDNFAIGSFDLEFAGKVAAGDVNGDGKINMKDVALIKAIIAGRYIPTAAEEKFADFNGDGKINASDLSAIKQYIAGN
jgi:transcription elongation factor Elf1